MPDFVVRNPDFRAAIAEEMTCQHFMHYISLPFSENVTKLWKYVNFASKFAVR
jgi:hypothetical protein